MNVERLATVAYRRLRGGFSREATEAYGNAKRRCDAASTMRGSKR